MINNDSNFIKAGDKNYKITEDAVYWLKESSNDTEVPIHHKISSRVDVIARVRDTHNGSWGILAEWRDPDGILHREVLSSIELQENGVEVRKTLANGGMSITPDKKSKDTLLEYLINYPVTNKARIVDKLGWHGNTYILPEQAFGEKDESDDMVIYQGSTSVTTAFQQKGNLNDWKANVASKVIEQNCLIFALSSAFAGQLLEPTNTQGGGFHIQGSSSTGKSTSQMLACSVWGEPSKYKKTWRTTDNALEGTALVHNDGLLVLDEIGECDNATLGKSIYMLANGDGKARMSKNIQNRQASSWQLLFLSSGEMTLADLLKSTGKNAKAGQEVRFVQINSNRKHGIFDKLTFADNAQQQSEVLKSAYTKYYGTAGIAWINHITTDKDNTKKRALAFTDKFMNRVSDNISGQAKRVAQRFALVAAGGEMATEANITGWKTGIVIEACLVLFNEWLQSYGKQDIEELNMLGMVKSFIEKHANTRFENVNNDCEYQNKTYNRAGFQVKGMPNTDTYYYFFDNAFENEVCTQVDYKQVLRLLHENNCLHNPEKGRNRTSTSNKIRSLGGEKRMIAVNYRKLSEYFDKESEYEKTKEPFKFITNDSKVN